MLVRLRGRATWLVSRAQLRAHGLLQDAFATAGTRAYHYRILAALDEVGAIGQTELGRVTGIDRSDVSLALDILCREGFATREGHPSDRRQKFVSLTDRGRVELRRLDVVLDAAQEQFLAPLNPDERTSFLALIAQLGGEPPHEA